MSSSYPSLPTKMLPTQPDLKAKLAIDEERRIYVGNLPYVAKVDDLQTLLAKFSDVVQDITMSIDPMTGRNPSYCFVDLKTSQAAADIMMQLNGVMFMGRPLKVKPAVRRRVGRHPWDLHKDNSPPGRSKSESCYSFDRWRRLDTLVDIEDLNKSAIEEGRRLYVGGLPRFPYQPQQQLEIQNLFRGFRVQAISKQIFPRYSRLAELGNHYYCFVDLCSSQECENAVALLNGLEKWNWTITVSRSYGTSRKLHERQRLFVAGLPRFPDDVGLENAMEELFAPIGLVKVVSKLLMSKKHSGNYCFVELAGGAQADAAIEMLDQTENWNCLISVRRARLPDIGRRRNHLRSFSNSMGQL